MPNFTIRPQDIEPKNEFFVQDGRKIAKCLAHQETLYRRFQSSGRRQGPTEREMEKRAGIAAAIEASAQSNARREREAKARRIREGRD